MMNDGTTVVQLRCSRIGLLFGARTPAGGRKRTEVCDFNNNRFSDRWKEWRCARVGVEKREIEAFSAARSLHRAMYISCFGGGRKIVPYAALLP